MSKIYWKYQKKCGEYIDDTNYKEYGWETSREGLNYMWKEGNWSCDCNRSMFFNLGQFDCGHKIKITKIDYV